MRGKLIVIDGTDGSGKATQTELLANRLRVAGFDVEIADFPQYNTKSAGLVEEYLSGKYGSPEEVGPYRASILYAIDRYDASFKIKKWLEAGKIVISNRYVTANMGHQGGKIANPLERKHFFDWLYKLEYNLFNIPLPDLNIILHVPAEIAQKLSQQRTKEDWAGKTNDIHQNDLNHLKNAESVYLEIARSGKNFKLIECSEKGFIKTPPEISELVWQEIKKVVEMPTDYYSRHHLFDRADQGRNSDRKDKKSVQAAGRPISSFDLTVEKILPQAKLPTKAYQGDAGLDFFSADYYSILPGQRELVRTGLKIAIPSGYAGLIWDKSGIARDGLHTIAGVIDSGYRGEVLVNIINLSEDIYHIAPGQKIAQLLIQKVETPPVWEEKIDETTDRRSHGFGSSGLF